MCFVRILVRTRFPSLLTGHQTRLSREIGSVLIDREKPTGALSLSLSALLFRLALFQQVLNAATGRATRMSITIFRGDARDLIRYLTSSICAPVLFDEIRYTAEYHRRERQDRNMHYGDIITGVTLFYAQVSVGCAAH